MSAPAEKTCRGCGHLGPLDDFMRTKKAKDGRGGLCHECNRRKAREWGRANPERVAQRAREWAQANPERKRAGDKRWAENNRERASSNSRAWVAKNLNLRREIVLRSDLKRVDKRRAYAREYWAGIDPAIRREWQRGWKKRNADKVALDNHRRRSTGDVDEPTYRLYVRVLHGDPCGYCGARAEAIDHVTALSAGGTNEWSNLTSTCTSCNSSKGASPLLLWLAGRSV